MILKLINLFNTNTDTQTPLPIPSRIIITFMTRYLLKNITSVTKFIVIFSHAPGQTTNKQNRYKNKSNKFPFKNAVP